MFLQGVTEKVECQHLLFSLKMAQWHLQKGGTVATCQHWVGNTRVDAKWEGYSPPGDSWLSWNVILRNCAELIWGLENGDKAWKWEATWQKGESRSFGSWQFWIGILVVVFADQLHHSRASWASWVMCYLPDRFIMGFTSLIGSSWVLVILRIVPGTLWITHGV